MRKEPQALTGARAFIVAGLLPFTPVFRHGGRDYRLTDVYGNVVHDILA